MNLELLKKLVLLANHNNTEGEANSAARRVCKMIEDGEFKFIDDIAPNGTQGIPFQDYTSQRNSAYQNMMDLMRDIQNRNPFSRPFYRETKSYKYGPTPVPEEEPSYKWDPDFNPFTETEKRSRKQQMRTCTKCGWSGRTYRFKENPFICQVCL